MARTNPPTGDELKEYMSSEDARKMLIAKGIKPAVSTFLRWLQEDETMGGFQPGGTDCRWYVHIETFQTWLSTRGRNGKN